MRSILLIAGAIVLIGGALLLMRNETLENSPPVTVNETATGSENEDTDTPDNMDMDDMDMTESEGEPAAGNDAGMEFPDMDMTVPEDAKVFDISGVNFEFNVKEIRVQEGDTVTVNFTSDEGFHDWVVDEFDAQTARVQTGGSSSVTFVADRKGTFEYYCSVGQHRENGMVGTLIVE